ncbi:MAG: hypothetical protein ACE5MH_00785 [Terriglobia bacterium]
MKRRTKIALGLLLGLALWVGWHIQRWGQPIPLAYERVAPGRYRLLASARTIYVAEDADGDGTVDRVYPEGAPERGFRRPTPGDAHARWLVVCLDGVPYAEMQALWEEGYFREFFRPVPVISPFPSASGLALTALFHTEPVAGYEDSYFDRARNRFAGGPLKTTTLADIPYLELLDYDMPGYLRGPAYLLPVKSYRADLGRLRKRFLASREKVFIAHLASTDSIYHVLQREQARALLVEVDSLLRELYYSSAGNLRITLFSDHGNSLLASQPVLLRAFLAEHGWRLTSALEGPRDVAVPAYGLIGFMAVYCQPAAVPELARTLAEMEGVDFVVTTTDSGVAVRSRRGRAQLDWTPDAQQFRYRAEEGDPLVLAPLLAELGRAGKVTPDGYVADADLFAATAQHRYPDPVYRLREWARNHVRNRADILVSFAPGYHQGNKIFEQLVTLQSAHGSLDRAQSTGFAMNTDGPLPPVLRAGDLLPAELFEPKHTPQAKRQE